LANKQIKITGDTSDLKKSLNDLSKSTKDSFKEVKNNAGAIKSEIDGQVEALKKASNEAKKYSDELRKVKSSVGSGIGNLPSGNGLMGGALNKLPGIGGLMKLGNPLMGALSMAGMAGYGISKGMAGWERYQSGIGDRLGLLSRGATNIGQLTSTQREEAANAGLNLESLNRLRRTSMDVFGRQGAENQSVIQRSLFERGAGLESGTLTNIGASLRSSLGGAKANEAVMKMQASLISSGIDDAIGPYLESATNLLQALNENSLTNNNEVLSALSQLTKETGDSPEYISKQLMSLDSTIKESSGERNAFLQSAFARSGIGGGSIIGTQAAVRSGGLFGADLTRLPEYMQRTLGNVGAGGQQTASAILSEFRQKGFKFGSGASREQMLESARGSMGFLGARNEVEGLKILDLLQKMESGDKDAAKKLQDLQKDPQIKKLEDIKNSLDGQIDAQNNLRNMLETDIGQRMAPAMLEAKQILTTIDENIALMSYDVVDMLNGILKFFGGGIKSTRERFTEAMSGGYKLTEEDYSKLTPSMKSRLLEKSESIGGSISSQIDQLKPYISKAASNNLGSFFTPQPMKTREDFGSDVSKKILELEQKKMNYEEMKIRLMKEQYQNSIEQKNELKKVSQKKDIKGHSFSKTTSN